MNITPSHPLRWFPEFWELGHRRLRPQVRLLALSLLVGVVAGLGAIAFYAISHLVAHYALGVLAGYHPHGPGGEAKLLAEAEEPLRPWMLLLVPAVGGLLSGILVFTLAPEAEGHGTDAAIDAYHNQKPIRPIVPLVKIFASAITIGTGGSGGREGPIAQIGAGFGSYLGSLLRLRPAERRLLLAAGMGAGVAAIFRAPLAGALFAAEVLYRTTDFESEAVIPAALASVTAYCTFGLVFGWSSLFNLPPNISAALTFQNPLELGPYFLLAVFMAVLAMLYTRSFYGLAYLFHHIPVPRHLRPAIGALLTGALGLGLFYLFGGEQRTLAVLSFGYGILQDAMVASPADEKSLSLAVLLLTVAVGKILTTGLTIGSGGSGGVFGPSMVIGGCAGGALGILLHRVAPSLTPHPATFVIVGMAGFFSAAAKTPVSTLLMVGELTGNYNLLLPALWVVVIAFLLSDEQSIYRSQVESHSLSPAHQGAYLRQVLAGLFVRQFLPSTPTPALRPGDRLPVVARRLSDEDFPALPVADAEGKLLGVVTLEEVLVATASPTLPTFVVAADLMRTKVMPLKPQETLARAMQLFVESDLLALPVVEEGRVIGVVRRADLAAAYLRKLQGPTPALEEELHP